jgi:hypothetical protein
LADVFWVAAGDIYAPEFGFSAGAYARFTASPQLAHIWLVPNPAHNPGGDFGLSAEGLALNLPKTAVMPGPAAPNSPDLCKPLTPRQLCPTRRTTALHLQHHCALQTRFL